MTQPDVSPTNTVNRAGFSNPLPLGIKVTDESFVKVYVDSDLLDDSEYSVAGIGDEDGIEITIADFDVDWFPDADTITASFEPPVSQPADLSAGGVFGLAFENALDAVVRILLSLKGAVDRAIKAPIGVDAELTLPTPIANRVLAWGSDGLTIVNGPDADELSSLTGVEAGRALTYPAAPSDPVYAAGGRRIGNVGAPSDANDAATKDYVDDASAAQTVVTNALDARLDAAEPTLAALLLPFLYKADPKSAIFKIKSGSGGQVLQIKAGTRVNVSSSLKTFLVDTDVTMPGLTGGKDYAVFVTTTGGVQAVLWDEDTRELGEPIYPTAPSANARMIGGFHYAPGGNAAAYNTGGNTTAQINPYSIWDDNFRPACPDPRGMTLVGGRFWCDIYLLNTTHSTRGTSRNGTFIAQGVATPLIPAFYGGDGVDTYPDFQWWYAVDVMSAHSKELLSYAEFMMAAYGVIEEQTRSGSPVTTGLATSNGVASTDAQYTSVWGLINATGAHWVWGRELSYGIFEGGYNEPPDGTSVPGSSLSVVPEYRDPGLGRGWIVDENVRATRALLFGSKSNNFARGGSISLDLANAINTTSTSISARGRAGHVVK